MILLKNISLNEPINVIVQNKPETFVEWLSNPNTIIALSAILISVFGLYYSVRYNRKTLQLTTTHNELSIQPKLIFYPEREAKNKKMNLYIKNVGLGLARIKSIVYVYKNKEYNDLFYFIKEKAPHINTKNLYYSDFNEGAYLVEKEKLILYEVEFATLEYYLEAFSLINDTRIIIKYESMYKVKDEIDCLIF